MALAVANRYTQALLDVVSRPGSPTNAQETARQLETFRDVLGESAELLGVLTSPSVEPAKKRRLIAGLSERLGLAKPVTNFFYVVIDHRRLGLLDEMIEAYRGLLDEQAGIARVEVSSARPMDAPARNALVDRFGRVTGKRVVATFDVDEDLLGGAVVRHESTVYDGSLRAQLKSLDRALTGDR